MWMSSCKDGIWFYPSEKDPVVAKVGIHLLHKSLLDDLVTDGTAPQDSAVIVDGFIQNWIRQKLMEDEAENNVSADINISKLVEDYRSSLLVYNFEKKLIDKMLDTIVSLEESETYYDNKKAQFLLSHPILKLMMAKISSKNKNLSQIEKSLKKDDLSEAFYILKDNASSLFVDTSRWLTLQEMNALFPENLLEKVDLNKTKFYRKKDGDYEYFVKILDYHSENSIPPFIYIRDRVDKLIVSERKNNILSQYRQTLYDEGIKKKSFEIFQIHE